MTHPKFPQHNKLPGRALARLARGQHLTHRGYQIETSTYRLAQYIFVLRGYGWPVQSVEKVCKTNDPTGRKATYAEYFFQPSDLKNLQKELGDKLDKFIAAVEKFEQNARAA
jgi:hypothetical protein